MEIVWEKYLMYTLLGLYQGHAAEVIVKENTSVEILNMLKIDETKSPDSLTLLIVDKSPDPMGYIADYRGNQDPEKSKKCHKPKNYTPVNLTSETVVFSFQVHSDVSIYGH